MTSSPAPDLDELAARLRRLHSPSRTVRAICDECGETRPCGVELLAEAAREAAESGRLREALRAVGGRWHATHGVPIENCGLCTDWRAALLATPPAPSDHGAGERRPFGNGIEEWAQDLAAPSVPPEETRP